MAMKGTVVQFGMMFIAWVGMIFYQQDSMIYHVRKYTTDLDLAPLESAGLDVETLRFTTPRPDDGEQFALLVRRLDDDGAKAKAKRVFLVFGGNAMLARDWLHIFKAGPHVLNRDTAVVLVDYPGFGFSSGTPSRDSIVRTGLQALNEAYALLSEDADDADAELKVGALGHSIGCSAAMAVAVALQESGAPLQHLVLSAPFTSLVEMAGKTLFLLKVVHPQLITQLTTRHAWDNIADASLLAGTDAPRVDIIHGSKDEMVPPEMGKTVWSHMQSLGFEASFKNVDADHNGLLNTEDYTAWLEGVLA